MVIYWDLVVILNFFVDFLLLMATGCLSDHVFRPGRQAAAALLGALYSGACLIPGFYFLGAWHWRLLSLAGMTVIAFGVKRQSWYFGALFFVLCMALGGIAECFHTERLPALLLAAGVLWLLCRLTSGSRSGGEEVPLEITYRGKTVSLWAFRDTGNTLRDPVTGERVLVVGAQTARQLTGLTQLQLQSPMETIGLFPGLRLIPYHTVGGSGMLLAMRFSQVKVGSRQQSVLIAFAPEEIHVEGRCTALAGGGCL